MQTKVLIAPTTDAVNHAMGISKREIGDIIQVDGTIGAGEQVELQQVNTDGSTSVITLNSEPMVLDENNTQRKLTSINRLNIYKPATAAPVGVVMISE